MTILKSRRIHQWALATATCSLFVTCSVARAQVDAQYRALVPQQLLGLIHAPEVHQELGLSRQQVVGLERLFGEIDGSWFRARNLPNEKRIEAIAQLENRFKQWSRSNFDGKQQQRLQQLEYRALGIRMLLRQDLAESLQLDPLQQSQLADLARATNDATSKLQSATMRNEVTDDLKNAVLKANEAERNALQTVMRPDQFQKLSQILGEPFDTSKLSRIYPMAPELEGVKDWINSGPLTLQQLRGKVVLVHFYAFQCHNCHANFGHYSKWHEKYGDDVVVLGIQTPETSRERDPNAVREAARERQLNFPIMVDLESKNWSKWSNTMWPTVYVIDRNGYIRQWWQGELNWQGATGDKTIEEMVDRLLQEDTSA